MKRYRQGMGKWMIFLAVLTLTLGSAVAYAQPIKVDKSKWPKNLSIGAGPMGSHGFMVASVWTSVLNKDLGLNIAAEVTGGAVHNVNLTNADTLDIGYTYLGFASDGWNGTAKWANNKQLRNIRGFLVGFPAVIHFYTLKKSGITKLQDLNGKVVSLNQLGSGSNLWGNNILRELGIKPSRIATASPADSDELLSDGTIAAALVMGSTPHSAIAELTATNKVEIIPFTSREQEIILKKYGNALKPYQIPAGTYKGQDKPVNTLSEYDLWITNTKIPDDLIYVMLQDTFAKKDELIKGFAEFKMLDPGLARYCSIPLSRGAYQFYKEKGVNIPPEIMPVK
jgi:TRAP transporter TAXI family solute receptor